METVKKRKILNLQSSILKLWSVNFKEFTSECIRESLPTR